jgi:hypothetical protein
MLRQRLTKNSSKNGGLLQLANVAAEDLELFKFLVRLSLMGGEVYEPFATFSHGELHAPTVLYRKLERTC